MRPLSRFFNLLNVTGILITWTIVVFVAAFLHTYSTSIDKQAIAGIVAVVILIPLFASPIIVACIHTFYRIYMDTVKRVFSSSYRPEKYMKPQKNVLDNSMIYPIPVQNKKTPYNKNYEEVKNLQSEEEAKSESFNYEGGENEQTLYFDQHRSKEHSAGLALPEITNNYSNVQQKAEPADGNVPDKSEEQNDDDYSVYEVKSDDNNIESDATENIGLMESEARSSENIKMILIF